ncbi:hypothetical protein GMOD_00009275 [Pyrenophora seminiperda CCB06]|uniref:Uncharacterized protein n=1 Tax=Pyrenophora seminiperda CCB06 TaxID=1302712 RepID=A0A3M7MBR7_9PLEO|nr:hypothetical protein GMOD_00009275 [Pyrenophora seminiperda CCB06]
MQFTIITIIAAAATFATANPTSMMVKRTCGTLTGTPLQICQAACTITCEAATAGLAKTLCTKACELGPLRRDIESEEEDDDASVLTIDARDADAAEPAASLAARMAEAEADPEAHVDMLVSRITGQQVCNTACDVACNSTILALAQTKCLEVCKGKCA